MKPTPPHPGKKGRGRGKGKDKRYFFKKYQLQEKSTKETEDEFSVLTTKRWRQERS